MTDKTLQKLSEILDIIDQGLADSTRLPLSHDAFEAFLSLLETGEARAAYPDHTGNWQSCEIVKTLILRGFKLGHLTESHDGSFQFCDKHNLWPAAKPLANHRIRIIPGGTAVRRGTYLADGVTIVPPAYVNIGAFVDEETMIDSHSLVGSCAQIGRRCHISAAAQIGGVIEPVSALPVIIEDACFVGGNTGVYEGAHLHRGAVLGSGVILTRSTPVFDIVHETVIRPQNGALHIPEGAVVIAGSRALKGRFAEECGLSAYTPIIVKYRDEKTDAALVLEELCR